MYLLQLTFDPTRVTSNSGNGRFEDNNCGPGNNILSKVWLQTNFTSNPSPPPTSTSFSPPSQGWAALQSDSVLLVRQAAGKTARTFYGNMVGVYFVILNAPAEPLTFSPATLFGRMPRSEQPYSSPFRYGFTASGLIQPAFYTPTPLPPTYSMGPNSEYTPGSTGFYLPLNQVINAPGDATGTHQYPFLVTLVATNSSGAVVGAWSHDPEFDVGM